MDIRNEVQKMDALVSKGEMVVAINNYFCDKASTLDYGKVSTNSKPQMIEKMNGFLGSIANVNKIKHHNTLVDGTISASEFTFDFDRKDGSKILWHEIIKREWSAEGKVTNETYFNAAS
ncbi:MAG: hypothetical protein ACRBFS_06330 [Aureispira sp.]